MRMYDEFADWWPLLSRPEDYLEEATFYGRCLCDGGDGQVRRVLELGSGGGNNASHLKRLFEMVLVEPSGGMRKVSQALNPECEHLAGDMRTVRLARQFDAVFVHDAVCYMTTRAELRAAMATAFLHTRPGGVALFAPDAVRETYHDATDHGGYDDGRRGLRYLEWTWDPEPSDTTYTVDYVLALRDASGDVRVEGDRHIEGLFARADWLRLLSEVGFDARALPFEHSATGPDRLEVFLAVRPVARRA